MLRLLFNPLVAAATAISISSGALLYLSNEMTHGAAGKVFFAFFEPVLTLVGNLLWRLT